MSRADINANALKVLYRLHNAGFESHLVGGCVRDLLLGQHPKDFDVATNANPEQIKTLFSNCRLIGRRFRLAHVLFGHDVIEVATFRGHSDSADEAGERLNAESGRILRDNVYGGIDEDVWRRDFTVNALYYNIADYSLIDYVGGIDDVRNRVIRLIGDPEQRYREDPVRMLRALRFASKLGFSIDKATSEPIIELGHLLTDIPSARLFDEVIKMFHGGAAGKSFALLQEYGLLKYLFPLTAECLEQGQLTFAERFLAQVLENTDQRIQEGKSVTPAFLFAACLWLPILQRLQYKPGDEIPGLLDIQKAGSRVLTRQTQVTAISRRFTSMMREIWALQPRLQRYTGKRALRLLEYPRFRAAYDFLCIRASAGEPVQERADWWTEVQTKDPGTQAEMAHALGPGPRGRRRRSPRKRKSRSKPAPGSK